MDCIFCKIVNKEIPADFLFESDKLVAFADIKPKAPIHILIVTKEHIVSIKELQDASLTAEMVMAAKKLAEEKKMEGYKLAFNVGRAGGQEVDHLHVHLMGGFN